MKIQEIISFLEQRAHPALQEKYDNCGLLTGDSAQACTGIICTLDATEDVILEAVEKKCNLVVAHHPIIFSGLKKINGRNYVERTVIAAIKNDIAIYAIHTSLDNVSDGVNGRIADRLGLEQRTVLNPRPDTLRKLYTFVPVAEAARVRDTLFAAGAGHISNYSECSFNTTGTGTFRGNEKSNPFVGEPGKRHQEEEIRIEVILPAWAEKRILEALHQAHPYEEVAYDMIALTNQNPGIGSGLVGSLPRPLPENEFLGRLQSVFGIPVIKHTRLLGRPVQKVAVCGGAGSSLIFNALSVGVEAYVTADIKYHEFFDANDRLLLCDVGHFESEQYTIDLLQELLQQNFPTFAVLKTGVKTNPVHYFLR
ncbi:MAG: Nif3-like dinuclear metal center hexameric protein [Chitinophagaceae bacterium]